MGGIDRRPQLRFYSRSLTHGWAIPPTEGRRVRDNRALAEQFGNATGGGLVL